MWVSIKNIALWASKFSSSRFYRLCLYSWCTYDVYTHIRICIEALFIVTKDWMCWISESPLVGTDLINYAVMCSQIWEPLLCGIKHFSSTPMSRKWLLKPPNVFGHSHAPRKPSGKDSQNHQWDFRASEWREVGQRPPDRSYG